MQAERDFLVSSICLDLPNTLLEMFRPCPLSGICLCNQSERTWKPSLLWMSYVTHCLLLFGLARVQRSSHFNLWLGQNYQCLGYYFHCATMSEPKHQTPEPRGDKRGYILCKDVPLSNAMHGSGIQCDTYCADLCLFALCYYCPISYRVPCCVHICQQNV